MCTAITYKTQDSYFGRNLDLEFSYGECVTVMPRRFILPLRHLTPLKNHHAVIGMAHIRDGFPLFYDGVNEHGLSAAGLRFTDSAPYALASTDKINVASFEFIPYILSTCASLKDVRELISDLNITTTDYSSDLPDEPLHWMIADRHQSAVLEQSKNGLELFDNPVGVMTNNPSFDKMMQTTFPDLPGGLSSTERFVRAVNVKNSSVSGTSEAESISQFFHILGAVSQPRGMNKADNGAFEITVYSSCMNIDKGIYYYKTYENSRITAIDLKNTDLDASELTTFPLYTAQDIRRVN